jgi:hypothetical protein
MFGTQVLNSKKLDLPQKTFVKIRAPKKQAVRKQFFSKNAGNF